MNFLISFGICSTPKLSKYITLLPFTKKAIQFVFTCPLKAVTSLTYRRPSGHHQGTNTKTDDLMKILFFRSNSPCITCFLLFFTERTNIQKF